jgi:hypothetical protein
VDSRLSRQVAVRELVPGLLILGVVIVDTEVPPPVLAESVLFYELVLLLGRWLVLAPLAHLIQRDPPLVDEPLRVFKGPLTQLHRHRLLLAYGNVAARSFGIPALTSSHSPSVM